MTESRNSNPPREQVDRLLEQYRDLTARFADRQLAALFNNANAALFDFAERAESNVVQGRFFDAMNRLQHGRAGIENSFRTEIRGSFARLSGSDPSLIEQDSNHAGIGGIELTLVSPEEIEESVATENLTLKAKSAYAAELYALSHRLSAITGRRVKNDRIPAGPYQLVEAYRSALAGLDIEVKAKIVLYALFDKFVIKQAGTLYEDLNKALADAGILPDLKQIHAQTARHAPTPESDNRNQHPTGTASPDEANDGASLGAELFDSIIELMGPTRRGRRAARSAEGDAPLQVSPRVQTATKETLVAAIDTLQTESAPRTAVATTGGNRGFPSIEVDCGLVDRVKDVLRQERAQILQKVDRDKLGPVDDNLIDLIGMLFEYMLNDPILPDSAKARLSHLHTPYLKLALIDKRLLVDTNHPARRLLNQMVKAGSLWIDEKNPGRGIFPAIEKTADRILREFKKDVSLFDELLQSFERAMDEQQRRTSTMEQRTQEAAQGKERLLIAKQRATTQLGRLTGRHALPRPVSNFLAKTWMDNLVFVWLRNQDGENGEEWQHAVQIADQLVMLFEPGIGDAERATRTLAVRDLRDEINLQVQRMGSYSHAAVDALLALLDDPQDWTPDGPAATDIEREPATNRGMIGADLIGQLETGAFAIAAPAGTLTEAEATMVGRLRKLRPGTWFEFQPDETGSARRIKLSWVSPLTSRCMFVDKTGVQAGTRELGELAREILSGRATIIPKPKSPFIDCALVSIRKMLQSDRANGPPVV